MKISEKIAHDAIFYFEQVVNQQKCVGMVTTNNM